MIADATGRDVAHRVIKMDAVLNLKVPVDGNKAKSLDLETLPGDTLSAASNINFFGQAIGSSGNTTAPLPYYVADLAGPITVIGRPFIWSQRSGMRDLNTLISANSGWVLNSVTGINFWGQIVGSGTLNGQPHGFLLTPKILFQF
jgi:hypothetical protein